MSARRDAISPARRADESTAARASVIVIDDEETACPVCGINLRDVPALEAERHARGCALALSQLDAETPEDGDDDLEADELEDQFAAVVDAIDRKRALEAAAQSLRETTRQTNAATTDRAIKSTETVEMWLHRIGMSAYFQPLYVKEDLLDVVDAIDRKRALEAAAQSLRETTRQTNAATTDRAIKSTETVEMWLHRIGMSAYFQPLYVKEDLLDVVDARECSAEDLVSVGVDAEDARALAFCGGAPPKWCAKQSSPDRIVTRARSAIARAREAAASNVERLWDVARGAENRGRGESLPSMDRLKRR